MVKIKCVVEKKEVMFSKFNNLSDDLIDIKVYYNSLVIPSDFDDNYMLEHINALLVNSIKNINLVNDTLKQSFYQLDDMQNDMFKKISDISIDELPLFDIELINRSNL